MLDCCIEAICYRLLQSGLRAGTFWCVSNVPVQASIQFANFVFGCIAKCIAVWLWCFELVKVRKEKSTYHTLNMLSLDVTKKCLVAEGWSPVFASKQVLFPFPASSGSRCGKQALILVFSYEVVVKSAILFLFL